MPRDHDPKKTALREEQHRRRIPPDAACATCGERDPKVLDNWEGHHVVGRAHDSELTVVVCKNCHLKLTEEQLRGGVPLGPVDHILERLHAILAALGAFFHSLGDAFDRWREQLAELLDWLDAKMPEWRRTLGAGT